MYFCMLLALTLVAAPAFAQQDNASVEKAVSYIRSQQQPDGSFAGFGPSSTADAVFALSAAGVNVNEVKQGNASVVDYLRAQAGNTSNDAGIAAKFLIALFLSGQSPQRPNGTDVVALVQRGYNAQTGQYGQDVTAHTYALISLVAAGVTPPVEAVNALKALQLPDGGWSFDGTAATGSDTNTTSLAVQALKATGDTSDAISKALTYYRAQQNADGGFPYSQTSQFGNASDANSTALSIQAFLAAGENLANWTKDGKTPTDRLLAFQNPSGAFRYQDAQPEDNAFATYQAVPAVVGKTLPLEPIMIALPAPEASPVPSASPAPSTPPADGPVSLPNTGADNLIPVLALVAGMLLLGGLVLNRRRT